MVPLGNSFARNFIALGLNFLILILNFETKVAITVITNISKLPTSVSLGHKLVFACPKSNPYHTNRIPKNVGTSHIVC
jgi:hypothetical protein